MQENNESQIKSKFAVFFILVLVGFIIFISILLYWTKIDRNLPKLVTSESNFALRGKIISADGYTLATSQKLYKVMVDTRNISPEKKELFVNLYSIYSGDNKKAVHERINSRAGNVVLSYKIDSKTAEHLHVLAKRLFKLGVFISYEDPKTGIAFLRGMNIAESGEVRYYPYKDILTPVLGHIKKVEKDSFTKVEGVKGIERYYEDRLGPIQDSYLIGFRDISGAIILNGNSKAKPKIDGYNIELTIPIKFQKSIENILDKAKKDFEAKEILAIVINSSSGDILSLASSNRYNMNSIKKRDYPSLKINAIEYAYEPGSVMKPVVYSNLLKEKKIKKDDIVNTFGGVYKLNKHIIRDEIKKGWISAEDVLTFSSNIGIAQLAQKLDGDQYYRGLISFGFGEGSGIDLPAQSKGSLQSADRLNTETYKATVAYGYGISVNLVQMVRALNVFNNEGKLVSPKIGAYIVERSGQKHKIESIEASQILPVEVANSVKKTLIKVVDKGSGGKARVDGVIIGGKTGTARISEGGGYQKIYNSSFIGFANDEFGAKYVIGVLVIEPTTENYKYFGSQSAAPIFKDIVEDMVEQEYLKKREPKSI